MRDDGLVVKCESCKKWFLESEGCPRCESHSVQKEPKLDVVFVSDDETAPLITEMLSRAKDSVLIASPWIWGITDILKKLKQLRKQKVDIAILTRRSGERDVKHEKTVTEIRGFGCLIDFIDELHAKILLVDESELYIGSANLIGPSLERNMEAGIWTNNPVTVSDARDYLSNAFASAFKQRLQK